MVEALDGVKIVSVAAGGWHSMAVADTGDLYVWGWNESGQLGFKRSQLPLTATPLLLDLNDQVTWSSVSCGSRHTIAVTAVGDVYAFGWNKYGQLGVDGATHDQPVKVPVDAAKRVSCKHWSSVIEC